MLRIFVRGRYRTRRRGVVGLNITKDMILTTTMRLPRRLLRILKDVYGVCSYWEAKGMIYVEGKGKGGRRVGKCTGLRGVEIFPF
jgi:hypothetical protein